MPRVTRRQSPTVKRIRVAATLRQLRDQTGMTLAQVAKEVGRDTSWLSRIEKAEIGAHPNDVRALLSLYGVPGAQANAVVEVAAAARERGWWRSYPMPEWFSDFVGFESEARILRIFQCLSIPGLLQTEAYARAVIQASATPDKSEEIERQVALRMERQALLHNDDPPQLRVILDEAVVRRETGGPEVMREQIRRLIDLSELPHVQIQVLPFSGGAHAGQDGPFIIIETPPMPEPYPDTLEFKVVYIDMLTSAVYLERPHEVAAYSEAFERLCAVALGPRETRDLMRTMTGG